MTRIAWTFLAYAAAIGAAAGFVLAMVPQAAQAGLPPYFWILVALLLFDAGAYLRGGGAPGTMITMGIRLAGLLVALVLMTAITMLSGAQVQFF